MVHTPEDFGIPTAMEQDEYGAPLDASPEDFGVDLAAFGTPDAPPNPKPGYGSSQEGGWSGNSPRTGKRSTKQLMEQLAKRRNNEPPQSLEAEQAQVLGPTGTRRIQRWPGPLPLPLLDRHRRHHQGGHNLRHGRVPALVPLPTYHHSRRPRHARPSPPHGRPQRRTYHPQHPPVPCHQRTEGHAGAMEARDADTH